MQSSAGVKARDSLLPIHVQAAYISQFARMMHVSLMNCISHVARRGAMLAKEE